MLVDVSRAIRVKKTNKQTHYNAISFLKMYITSVLLPSQPRMRINSSVFVVERRRLHWGARPMPDRFVLISLIIQVITTLIWSANGIGEQGNNHGCDVQLDDSIIITEERNTQTWTRFGHFFFFQFQYLICGFEKCSKRHVFVFCSRNAKVYTGGRLVVRMRKLVDAMIKYENFPHCCGVSVASPLMDFASTNTLM